MKYAAQVFLLSFLILASMAIAFGQPGGDGKVSRPSDEAVVDTKIPPYRDISNKLNELQKLPTPRVMFSFDGERQFLTALAPDAKAILDNHWKEALTFYYSEVFLRPMNSTDFTGRRLEWIQYCTRTLEELTKTTIKAPASERTISVGEAMATYDFLNRVAFAVIEKAKNKHIRER